jgi:Flp pilus assembly protein TadG
MLHIPSNLSADAEPCPPRWALVPGLRFGRRGGLRRTRRFIQDKSGAAALEFAMVSLPFLAMIICIIEVGVDFLFFSQIDYATHKAAQEIRSGSVQMQNLTATQFKTNVICPKLTGLTCSSLQVNVGVVRNTYEWSANWTWWPNTVNPATAKWCPGGAADTILIQLAYPVPLASMIWAGAASNANGVRYYLSAAAFRNDPFGLPVPATAGC